LVLHTSKQQRELEGAMAQQKTTAFSPITITMASIDGRAMPSRSCGVLKSFRGEQYPKMTGKIVVE